MASAERKDLRSIWECLSLSWKIYQAKDDRFEKRGGEEAWKKLEQFLDLTDEELRATRPDSDADPGPKRASSSLEAHKRFPRK